MSAKTCVAMVLLFVSAACTGRRDTGVGEEAQVSSIALELASGSLSMNVGEELRLVVNVDTSGPFTAYVLRYEVDDDSVARVDSDGRVTAFGVGAATVRVSATLLGADAADSAALSLTVLDGASPQAPTVVLSTLPMPTTPETTASISYAVQGAIADTVVYCRRDAYEPVVCQNPFRLGFTTPLEAGAHRVDYYLGTSVSVDDSTPAASYAWTVLGATSGPPSSDALPRLLPVGVEAVSGRTFMDEAYSSQPLYGADGLARLQTLTSFEGIADTVYLHRIVAGDPTFYHGFRSELSWYGDTDLLPGRDYWFAFALRPLEWHGANGDAGDNQIVFQIHQNNDAGDTSDGPTLAFMTSGADDSLLIDKVSGTGSVESEERIYAGGAGSRPPSGTWTKLIVHLRLGYLASHAPLLEVWRDGNQIVTHTGNIGAPNARPDYPKIGIYKWRENWNTPERRSAYYSDLFFGQGTDRFAEASAALAGF